MDAETAALVSPTIHRRVQKRRRIERLYVVRKRTRSV